jgi:membrane-bound metal-dependent hydrolase YbcI (DUF457 family)
MDIVTHAGIGLIAASPFLATKPELALGIVAGSVLPDLDALWRLLDKKAFLRAHQAWTHALPIQIAFSVVAGIVGSALGVNGFELGGGVLAGLAGHTFLDMTNTFGVAWLIPFSRRRLCLEWVFFIDALTLALVVTTLALLGREWFRNEAVSPSYAVVFFGLLSLYIIVKAVLRSRAGKSYPNAKSLIPSTCIPWRFFGTEREQNSIVLFKANALTGSRTTAARVALLDESFDAILAAVPEFRLMRELSSEYHVISAATDGSNTHLLCRDMRTRSFGTRFGDLEVWVDGQSQVTQSRFHV